MDDQEVSKSRCTVYRCNISVVMGHYLVLVIFIVVYVQSFPVLIHLKGCLGFNFDLNPLPIILLYQFKDFIYKLF